jgi:hypothetical protein
MDAGQLYCSFERHIPSIKSNQMIATAASGL